jgi:protoporphyrinogen/coproporphyrinogen III oxidase
VVATIPPSQLGLALKQRDNASTSDFVPSPFTDMLHRLSESTGKVNVMVVNLFYHNPNLIPYPGFGYLIPRSVSLDQNPERALGVIFGSETSRGFTENDPGQDTATGTKLTVMMGGHWWNSWSRSDFPDEQTAIDMAESVLTRHLGITEKPLAAKARLQKNAIPQYEVGHHERMSRLHRDLQREFGGRLKVAGSAYQGVGVNDCIGAARRVSFDIREGFDDRTGLERFDKETKWAIYKRREKTVYMFRDSKRRGSHGLEDG